MLRHLVAHAAILFAILLFTATLTAGDKERTPAERGWLALSEKTMNPGLWSPTAYDNLWKLWGIKEKPAEYDQAVRQRYGLQTAPFDNHGLPLGLQLAPMLLGKGIVNNCLLCHAGTVAGQTVIGLGNSALDLQGLFDDLSDASSFALQVPFRFSYTRGTIDPINAFTYLMSLRNPDLKLQQAARLPYSKDVCSDPPAWWLLKRKKTRDWTGNIDARSTRVDMVNLLSPFNSGDHIKKQEPLFADISAFLLTVQPPQYPFPVDREKAARGKELFAENCKKCHGTRESYPNKIIPLNKIGTDPVLCRAQTLQLADYFNKSWLARELSPDGKPIQVMESTGYQAPPLDGVWATAPYFHNGSAPTVYHVLNSTARPKYFTRSYGGQKEDYDPAFLGLKIKVLDRPADPKLPGSERRKVYDTTLPGRGNGGHTYGDTLTEDERLAVIEFLKTM
jgi:mono/diheme cytochrome c family protein